MASTAYPDVFASGAIIAGLPYGCATTIPQAFDRMRGQGGPNERELHALIRIRPAIPRRRYPASAPPIALELGMSRDLTPR